MTLELVARAVLIGAGATVVMDLWAWALRRLGVPSLSMAWLGRWIGHMPRGRFAHEHIARAVPVRGETAIGWGAHYAIGVSFAALLLAIAGLDWARSPTPLPALAVGVVTVVAPWFVRQPAMSRARPPLSTRAKSLVTHAVFGLGLDAAALATAAI